MPDNDADLPIVDKHHSDRKTEVLYELDEMATMEFNFRDTVLDQLERYFVYLDRMTRHDRGSELYKQVGAILIPYVATPDVQDPSDREGDYQDIPKLSPWFLKNRPAFGCIAYGTSPEAERIEMRKHPDKLRTWIPRF